VRAFLADEIAAGVFNPHEPQREDTDVPEFSRRVGERGWIGMTWPKQYGGHERTFLERYIVTEEMRIANAPTAASSSPTARAVPSCSNMPTSGSRWIFCRASAAAKSASPSA
jgi:alkylation response protein AidB-like acyl-CoA dehydrogenase